MTNCVLAVLGILPSAKCVSAERMPYVVSFVPEPMQGSRQLVRPAGYEILTNDVLWREFHWG